MTPSVTYPIKIVLVEKSSGIHYNSCRLLEKTQWNPSTLIILLISLCRHHYGILDFLFLTMWGFFFFFMQPAKI